MSGHTPDLRVRETPSGKFDEMGDCAIVDATGKIVGEAYELVDYGDRRPAKANAALWAAAPDLLAAARMALKELQRHEDQPGNNTETHATAALRAAIAKAQPFLRAKDE